MQHPDIERNEAFDLAFRFVTETSENIFLTGNAGTGKTTFLKYLKEHCGKNMIVAAPTGVASINAGGVTLHSLFQLPFMPFLPTPAATAELLAKLKYNRQRQDLLRKTELLVIDEISMVRCDVLDAIDAILRAVRRQPVPFGGLQVLCIGDLYQLPPVARREEWELLGAYYPSPFFFDSQAVREQMPILIELTKIYRQKEDVFIRLLNKVRNNEMSADDLEHLHERYLPGFAPGWGDRYITLTSHNKQADLINSDELQKLSTRLCTYKAAIEGDFPESMFPAEGLLVLKEGAQVMFLKNDVEKTYFNGKIGVVKKLLPEEIVVDCDGTDVFLEKEIWENVRYTLDPADGKLKQETLGAFTQFPLRLAWAITIHKSQGLTFERVMIDAGAAFTSGQVYVALSRCTSLDGIVLLSRIPASAISSNEHVIKGQQYLRPKGSLSERFAGARQVFTLQLLEEVFSFEKTGVEVEKLAAGIADHKEKLNDGASEWMDTTASFFSRLRTTGLKFLDQAARLMREQSIIEENPLLQQRINDAAAYFMGQFSIFRKALDNHPLITEHRETASAVDEHLNNLLQQADQLGYYLAYCKEAFSVTAFLQHKLAYRRPALKASVYASGKKPHRSDGPNPDLYAELRQWRDKTVEEAGVPIYMVANHAALQEIAALLPFSRKDLLKIKGFGKAKAEKYGDEIIDIVVGYCTRNGISTKMTTKAAGDKQATNGKT